MDMVPKEGWGKTKEEMEKFCKEFGFVDYFETSAKEDIEVDQAAVWSYEVYFR